MKDYKAPYTIIGVALGKRELSDLQFECSRTGLDRSEVIKKALKYWLTLDVDTKARDIMQG